MSNELKPCARIRLDDEVYVHGYVDEIRRDTVIIRNDGGYFGTALHEVMPYVASVCADDVPEQLQVIKNAESYKLADDSGPQVIAASEKHELADSRERLEADVREICWGHAFYRYDAQKRYLDERGLDVREDIVTTNYDGHVLATVIMHLLDRQAAITERELCAKCEWPNLAAMPDLEQQERIAEQDRRIVEYAEQVDSLTAKRDELRRQLDITRDIAREFRDERDELQSIIDHMPKTEQECEACQEAHDRLMFNAKVHQDELRDKLKHKQLVIDRQRDSFAKMEREYRELQDVCGELERTIENLRGD